METGTFSVNLGGLSLPWNVSGNQALPPAHWSVGGPPRSSVLGDQEFATGRPRGAAESGLCSSLDPLPRPHLPCSIFVKGSVRLRHPWEPEWRCLETTGQQIWITQRREGGRERADSLVFAGWMVSRLQGLAEPLSTPPSPRLVLSSVQALGLCTETQH